MFWLADHEISVGDDDALFFLHFLDGGQKPLFEVLLLVVIEVIGLQELLECLIARLRNALPG